RRRVRRSRAEDALERVADVVDGAGEAVGAGGAELPAVDDRQERRRRQRASDELDRAAPRIEERRLVELAVADDPAEERVRFLQRGLVGIELALAAVGADGGEDAEELEA